MPPQCNCVFSAIPLEHPDYFDVCGLVRVPELFEARVHLGHKEGSLHPEMRQYVLGSRLEHTIIDLDVTASLFRRALQVRRLLVLLWQVYTRCCLQVTAHIVYRGGLVLFLAPPGRPLLARATEDLARDVKEFAHARPWRKGTFTNAEKLVSPGLLSFGEYNIMSVGENKHHVIMLKEESCQ